MDSDHRLGLLCGHFRRVARTRVPSGNQLTSRVFRSSGSAMACVSPELRTRRNRPALSAKATYLPSGDKAALLMGSFLGFPVRRRSAGRRAAAERQGLDEAGVFGRVSQSVPEPFDGGIQTVIKIDEGIGGPEPAPQFLTCDDLPRLFKKQAEDLE